MGNLTMSRKEIEQIKILEQIISGNIPLSGSGERLGMSDRQVSTKLKRYKDHGEEGLIHKSRGKPSLRKWNSEQEEFTINLLRSEWKGFGPTFTAEKLEEIHGIKVSRETVRQAMKRAGIWLNKKDRPKHRRRRERRDCIGQLIQLDGSPHDWFEGRGPRCTLLVFIDDATSKILWLKFVDLESVESIMTAVREYITKFGRPLYFYVDRGSVFHVNNGNSKVKKLTQFERAMKELGIKVIHANSPEAKGRVERSNSTHQDRLIKEMRIAKISSIEQANLFIQEYYIPKHNKKFEVQPNQSVDVHRSIDGFNLDEIFCIKEERVVANDFVVNYKTRLFQIHGEQKVQLTPGRKVTILAGFDRNIKIMFAGVHISFTEITQRIAKPKKIKIYKDPKLRPVHPNSQYWASGKLSVPTESNMIRSKQ